MEKIFCSIKEACDVTGLSKFYLRNGCKDGTVPHIMSGGKYMVNIPILIEKLNIESEVHNETVS